MDASFSSWDREHAQREELINGLLKAMPDDIIMLSDVDEIINADAVRKVLENPPANNEVYCLKLRYFHFFLNLEVPKRWLRTSPRAVRYASLRNMRGLRSLRSPHKNKARNFIRWLKTSMNMRRITKRTVIPNAGWHFSWLGGEESVAIKAQ